LLKLFADFLEKAVERRIEPYSNKKVTYTGESTDESYAEVDSKLLTPRGEKVKINCMLRRLQSEWKIYDLIVEDVGLVNNYRAQFSRVISNSSYGGTGPSDKAEIE
jgi:phospholipid transport system substrate-binding protein